MAGTDQNVPILSTKLYRPLVTADFVPRETLEARLNAGIELPLTVVSAPAGYGKSTLVSHWLETCGFPGAWLSLDDSDSDVRVFLSYLAAAVRTVSAGACSEFLKILNAENLPPLQVVAAHLSNELDALEERLILVLDDYYRIREPAIHTLIDSLLEHPHRFLHLVIVSRRDPVLSLASLRARHMLNEIRIKDLAFSSDETLTFFRQAVGHSVDASTIDRLHEHTEGWPVAIRLAALALRNQDDVDGFLSRYGTDARPLHEYLVAEVLSGQSELVRSQLLDTSVLRRFNASLCEAVWSNDSDDEKNSLSGKNFIKNLETSGLFCVALDGRREWFRFHHLFRDLLVQQSVETRSKEKISGLHQRASRWFETNGYFEEAIHHALAGGDEGRAADIVGYARHELMNRDQWHRLERWLKLFSHDTVLQHPQLMVLRCWLDLSHWYRLDFLVKDLDRTDALLETSSIGMRETSLLKTEVSVIHSSLAYWTVDPSLAVTLTEPALSDASGEQEYVQSVALMYQGGALQLLGDLQQAERLIRDHIGEERFKNQQFSM
jgi:LuxR family maltose regulon positive regulatory protein